MRDCCYELLLVCFSTTFCMSVIVMFEQIYKMEMEIFYSMEVKTKLPPELKYHRSATVPYHHSCPKPHVGMASRRSV